MIPNPSPGCWDRRESDGWLVGACRKTQCGFERPFFLNRFTCCCRSDCRIKAAAVVRLAASGCIDDRTNPPMAEFAVFARRKQRFPLSETRLRQQPKTAKEKMARSRADDGVFRQSLIFPITLRYAFSLKPFDFSRLRTRTTITYRFSISSSGRLWPFLNRELLDPSTSLGTGSGTLRLRFRSIDHDQIQPKSERIIR